MKFLNSDVAWILLEDKIKKRVEKTRCAKRKK